MNSSPSIEEIQNAQECDTQSIGISVQRSTPKEWVTLAMKLLDWSFYDFEVTVTLETTIIQIVDILRDHHGTKMEQVVMYGTEIRQSKELNDFEKSLKEYGFEGSVVKEDAPITTLYYNFKPAKHKNASDPILLSWK